MDKVKLTDIAKATGVSASTVSIVFNNRPGIPLETRQRVLDTAERLGYKSDRFQAIKNTLMLKRVGLVLRVFEGENSQINPFYSVIISGIEAASRQNQTQLLYSHLHVDFHNRPIEALPEYDKVDGLILVGMYIPEGFVKNKPDLYMPVVLVDGYSENDRYDAVVSRNFSGAYMAVEYLIQKGHREIGMIAASQNSYPSLDERRAGYNQALLDHGIQRHSISDCMVHVTGEDYNRAAYSLLSSHPEITALFCALDPIAVEALKVAQDLGRRVPEDLSIMGFDGIDLCAMVRPAITTVFLNQYNMGQLAVRLLQQRVQHPKLPQVISSLPYQLIERESTRTLEPIERR
jgi:DNA-binding LacI/PurR family transcriptional regulator